MRAHSYPLLQHDQHPEDANASPFIIGSGHPDFYLALALLEEGVLREIGETYLEDGEKFLALRRAGAATPRRNPGSEFDVEMTFDESWYTKRLLHYSGWKEAWFREAIQNSVDAGATRVALKVDKASEDPVTWTVECLDNGSGMDRDTLINKFLRFGATTKTGAGATGGFGEAKELLILPWLNWEIRTQDSHLRGLHAKASMVPGGARLDGTMLRVTMPDDNTVQPHHADTIITRSYLPDVRFTIESGGEKRTVRANASGDEVYAENEHARITYRKLRKGETTPYMWVRVKGLYMFQKYIGDSVNVQVFCDLLGPSTQVLTANRGDLNYDTRAGRAVIGMLGEVETRLHTEKLRGLRGKFAMREKYSGKGKFRAEIARSTDVGTSDLLAVIKPADPQGVPTDESLKDVARELVRGMPSSPEVEESFEIVGKQLAGVKFTGPTHVASALKQLVWTPDFFLLNDEDKTFRVPAKFKPESMTGNIHRLAKVWTEMVRFVMMQLAYDGPWGVGFVFSSSSTAMYAREGGEDWILLNPFTHLQPGWWERKEIINPSDPQEQKQLYSAAIHEATHLVDRCGKHDDVFASALTDNFARCADGFAAARGIARRVKGRGEQSLEGPKKKRWQRLAPDDNVFDHPDVVEKVVRNLGEFIDVKMYERVDLTEDQVDEIRYGSRLSKNLAERATGKQFFFEPETEYILTTWKDPKFSSRLDPYEPWDKDRAAVVVVPYPKSDKGSVYVHRLL